MAWSELEMVSNEEAWREGLPGVSCTKLFHLWWWHNSYRLLLVWYKGKKMTMMNFHMELWKMINRHLASLLFCASPSRALGARQGRPQLAISNSFDQMRLLRAEAICLLDDSASSSRNAVLGMNLCRKTSRFGPNGPVADMGQWRIRTSCDFWRNFGGFLDTYLRIFRV